MKSLIFICLITVCYTGYNLLVKVSGNHNDSVTSAPIVATICLQLAALSVSLVYLLFLIRQGAALTLPPKTYLWAALGGLSIGVAEVLYFYLFRGFAGEKPIAASFAIPIIVGGTVVLAVLASWLLLGERINVGQWLGLVVTVSGLMMLGIYGR